MPRTTRIAAAVAVVVVLGGCGTSAGTSRPSPAIASPTSVPSPAAGKTGMVRDENGDVILYPKDALADPAGADLPGDLIGRKYAMNPPHFLDNRQEVLTLRPADDPHCLAMYGGQSTCFTVLWDPVKSEDPGARGSARTVDGKLVLGLALVPFDQQCVGESATYAYEDAGQTLRGIETPACTFPGFRQLGASTSAADPWVFDTRSITKDFSLPMRVTVPGGWKPLHGIGGALGLVHTGYPEGPDSTWWGPDLLLVENAEIHDPSDVVSSEPARSDHSRFLAWPADFFGYITALPGVTVVSGPEPVTVGGVTGTQIVVMTPPMHPLVWLKGDTAWLGGGPSGVDPAQERRFVELKTGGHTLLVQLGWDPSTFEAKNAELQTILDSISFD